MEKASGYVTAHDGLRLYFERIGDGHAAVIFPNGMYLRDAFCRFAANRTLVFYDLRNRGRSDAVSDAGKRKSAILKDVADLEAVRCHFASPQISVVGHSYMSLVVALYAMTFPENVHRVVQLSPIERDPGKAYPPHLKWSDGIITEVFGRIAKLREEQSSLDAQVLCEKFWELLRATYVFNPVHAEKIKWGRCDLPNERGFMKYWSEDIFPSMQALNLAPTDFARATAPTLIVHGTKDRSAAYGGARDWAMLLPNARLITLEDVSHAPWIEAPDEVFRAIGAFLNGEWPDSSEVVRNLEPKPSAS